MWGKKTKIERLQKILTPKYKAIETITSTTETRTITTASTSNSTIAALKTERLTFSGYGTHFDTQQLAKLRSIGNEPRDDCAFVRTAMQHLYKDNLDSLKNKSLTGQGKNKDVK